MSYLFPDTDEAVRIGQGSVPQLLFWLGLRWAIVFGALLCAEYLIVRIAKFAWES